MMKFIQLLIALQPFAVLSDLFWKYIGVTRGSVIRGKLEGRRQLLPGQDGTMETDPTFNSAHRPFYNVV